MLVIGITGGVGAGKSRVLKALEEHCNCKIILADDVGNKVKEPGQRCYLQIIDLLGEDILKEDATIDKVKMAAKIFSDSELLEQVNKMIHPAVEEYILNEIQKLIEEELKVETKKSFYKDNYIFNLILMTLIFFVIELLFKWISNFEIINWATLRIFISSFIKAAAVRL